MGIFFKNGSLYTTCLALLFRSLERSSVMRAMLFENHLVMLLQYNHLPRQMPGLECRLLRLE
jgi:hypothetical protein